MVKGKKLPAARNEDGRILSDREEEDEEEEEAEEALEAAEQRRRVSVSCRLGQQVGSCCRGVREAAEKVGKEREVGLGRGS